MKQLIFASMMTLFSATAFADLAEYHEKVLCNSKEAKALNGDSGSCDILISQDHKVEKRVACFGAFNESLNCMVLFMNQAGAAATVLKCGEGDISIPVFEKTMEAEFAHYNVAALITTSNSKKEILHDASSHSFFGNKLLSIFLEENKEQKLSGDVVLMLDENTSQPLKNVQCRYF